MLKEKIYLGAGNSNDLNFQRKRAGVWVDFPLTFVTRVVLSEVEARWLIDSTPDPAVFEWPLSGYPSKMKITAGGKTLPKGSYNCFIKLYLPEYPTGYRWGEVLQVQII